MQPDAQLSQQIVPLAVDDPSVSAPLPASIQRRLGGWIIDYVIVMVPGLALVILALAGLVHALPGYLGAVGADVGWSHLVRLIVGHGREVDSLKAAALDEWTAFARPLIGALLAVPLIQFVYQATLLSWPGRTIGKIVADMRVDAARTQAAPRRLRQALRRALSTTVVETGLVGVAFAAITIGHFYIGLTVWAIALVAFWVNAFMLLGPRRRTLVDRVAGTVVVRTALYAHAVERAAEVGRRMSDAAIAARGHTSGLAITAGRTASEAATTAGQKTSEAAISAGRITSDAAAVAGQLAREGAEAIARSAPVQQTLNSRAGQQVQALGAAGADRARQLGGQATDQARRLSGHAKQVWQERQTKRRQQAEPQLTPKPDGQAAEYAPPPLAAVDPPNG